MTGNDEDLFVAIEGPGRPDGFELCYRRVGDPSGPPLLLVMGLGAQLVAWPAEFVQGLADRHFDVVLFDNRDIGRSTGFDQTGPTGPEVTAMFSGGDAVELPYSLADMAADAAALIEALELGPTHVLGVSMGGMIVQQLALDHPASVASLTSIMSTTGAPDVGQPTPEAIAALTRPAVAEREASLDATTEAGQVWASPESWDPEDFRSRVAAAWDRVGGPQGDGTMRQLGAIMTAEPRDDRLRSLDVPTLVIHGDVDPLIPPSGGERTASVIPGAELMMLDGMGHDLPPIHWQQITEGVLALALRSAS